MARDAAGGQGVKQSNTATNIPLVVHRCPGPIHSISNKNTKFSVFVAIVHILRDFRANRNTLNI